MATVMERVITITAETLAIMDGREIKPESRFVKDLAADSLDLVQLVMAFEEAFEIGSISDTDAETITDVEAAVAYIKARGVND